jgi:hypothetical protein
MRPLYNKIREMSRACDCKGNIIILNVLISILRLGLEGIKVEKKGACPARVAEAGQENIKTVHAPKHIQTASTL